MDGIRIPQDNVGHNIVCWSACAASVPDCQVDQGAAHSECRGLSQHQTLVPAQLPGSVSIILQVRLHRPIVVVHHTQTGIDEEPV